MKQYIQLLKDIQENGTYKAPARENMPGTTSLFGYQFRRDLADGFPALTTKKLYWKGVVAELLWFLRGDTNIKFLDERGVTKMWHQDSYNYYVNFCKIQSLHPCPFDEFCDIVKNDPNKSIGISGYSYGDCGYQYGKSWRDFGDNCDQIVNLINGLLKNPEGRRHIVTSIDPTRDQELALYWCHAMFQFNCRPLTKTQRSKLMDDQIRIGYHAQDSIDDITEWMNEHGIPKYYLDCQMYQRSADVFLGVPLNIASYALLTHIIAKICGMVPGDFVHTFGDVHIYDNHKEAVSAQLKRDALKLPELEFSNNFYVELQAMHAHNWDGEISSSEFDEFIFSLGIEDFILRNYESHPAIQADLSTGIKK